MKKQKWLILGAAGAAGSAAGLLAVRTYQRFQRDWAQAVQRVERGSQIIQTELGPIETGTSGDGPPVLVVHGAGGGYDQGLLAAGMAGNDFRAIAMSRFGYLGTPLPDDASHEAQADAHAALLDAMQIPKATIVGISAGGPSSLQFAIRHPERCTGLVMISAVSKRVPMPEGVNLDFVRSALNCEFVGWLLVNPLRALLLAGFGITPGVWAELTPFQKAWAKDFLRSMQPVSNRTEGLINDYVQHARMSAIPMDQIKVPTLVIHALDDTLVPPEHAHLTASSIAGAELLELPSGGHMLIGQHERAVSEVRKFIMENSA